MDDGVILAFVAEAVEESLLEGALEYHEICHIKEIESGSVLHVMT